MHIPPHIAPSLKPPLRIEVFGFDVAEISQIRRIRALRALGHDVRSFTMRRNNMNAGFSPDWPNTHLFYTRNENLLLRAGVVAASIVKSVPHRQRLRNADMIIARNLDMLAIAWAARQLAGAAHVPLVYECLDINAALCRPDAKGRAVRAAERFLLRRIDRLIVSSPGYVREYFAPVQRYRGPWSLWENKLAASGALPPRPNTRRAAQAPLRVGWVGTIRCAPSLELLTALADNMGPAGVQVHVHGVVHTHAVPGFDAAIAARENMYDHGPYAYPDSLAKIYAQCDVVWAQDLWQRGNNSDWLLPNRIYEASWAGCPSIALAQTETGRRIVTDKLGWVIEKADAPALAGLLQSLDPAQITRQGEDLLNRPADDFVQTSGDISAVVNAVATPRTEAA